MNCVVVGRRKSCDWLTTASDPFAVIEIGATISPVAVWQFVFDLVPASAAKVAGVAAARMSREQLDGIVLNFSSAETQKLFACLETMLPEKKSWSTKLRIWGDEKTDDVQVGMNEQTIEDVRFRLNVGKLSLPLIGDICLIARNLNCLFATPDGAIVHPNREAVIRAVTQSRAMRYVCDPQGFLEEAIRLDGRDD